MEAKQPVVEEGLRSEDPPQDTSRNLLELLSAQRVPDAILTILLTLLIAFTLAPYLGGRKFPWIGPPLSIPTVTETFFWLSVFASPLLWAMVLGRVYSAGRQRLRKIAAAVVPAVILTMGLAALHHLNPDIGLTAVDSSYRQQVRIPARNLTVGRNDDMHAYFVTQPIDLQIPKGCSLRIETVELTANGRGRAFQQDRPEFDFQFFAGPRPREAPPSGPTPATIGTVPGTDAERRFREPDWVQIAGRAVVRLSKDAGTTGLTELQLRIRYDFSSARTTYSTGFPSADDPRSESVKETTYQDIRLDATNGSDGAWFQLLGWTLWGSNGVELTIDDPLVRINGKRLCSFATWI